MASRHFFIPIEVRELVVRPHWFVFGVLAFNVLIVCYFVRQPELAVPASSFKFFRVTTRTACGIVSGDNQ